LGQVALNWCISHPNVIAIPKSDRVDRTVENCGASGWQLTQEQISRLDEAFAW
jgi:diketogulonate reductase-like aldo/keto reductase